MPITNVILFPMEILSEIKLITSAIIQRMLSYATEAQVTTQGLMSNMDSGSFTVRRIID